MVSRAQQFTGSMADAQQSALQMQAQPMYRIILRWSLRMRCCEAPALYFTVKRSVNGAVLASHHIRHISSGYHQGERCCPACSLTIFASTGSSPLKQMLACVLPFAAHIGQQPQHFRALVRFLVCSVQRYQIARAFVDGPYQVFSMNRVHLLYAASTDCCASTSMLVAEQHI